jgi:hypothetical protein
MRHRVGMSAGVVIGTKIEMTEVIGKTETIAMTETIVTKETIKTIETIETTEATGTTDTTETTVVTEGSQIVIIAVEPLIRHLVTKVTARVRAIHEMVGHKMRDAHKIIVMCHAAPTHKNVLNNKDAMAVR